MTMFPTTQLSLLRSLLGYAVRVRPDIILATMAGTVSSIIELASLASLIPLSRLAAHQPLRPDSPWTRIPHAIGMEPNVKFYITVFVGLVLLRSLTQSGSSLMVSQINRRLIAHFSAHALEANVRHLTFAQVQSHSIGHFMALAADEPYRAAQIVAWVMRLVPMFALFLLYTVMLFAQSWQTGAALMVFCLIAISLLLGAFRKSHRLGKRQLEEARAIGTHFAESLSGLRTVRSLNGEGFVTERYETMHSQYARTGFSIDALNEFARSLPTTLLTLALLVASQVASAAALSEALPVIMVDALMVLRLLPLAAQTVDISQRLVSDLKAAESVHELLQAVKSARVTSTTDLPELENPIHRIEFRNVSFRYASDLPLVLDDFSTTFVAGKSYVISGPSGAGKSTLIDLLLKFFEPQSGSINVNGRDIVGISSQSLRTHVVLAEQSPRIFYDTIAHNVRFGRRAHAMYDAYDYADELAGNTDADLASLRAWLASPNLNSYDVLGSTTTLGY